METVNASEHVSLNPSVNSSVPVLNEGPIISLYGDREQNKTQPEVDWHQLQDYVHESKTEELQHGKYTIGLHAEEKKTLGCLQKLLKPLVFRM